LGPDGEPVDVSKPFGRLEGAPTYVYDLEPEARALRMLLVEAMLKVGFSNCRDEWWHYSYGDAGWAVRTGRKECAYGLAELPMEEYLEQEKLWLEEYAERKNPFICEG
jgi:zinc D-Ala-D-Ala dipeptidase